MVICRFANFFTPSQACRAKGTRIGPRGSTGVALQRDCSTLGVHEMSTPGSPDSREKAQEAQKEPDQYHLLKSADS
jgi:hypothetical protein